MGHDMTERAGSLPKEEEESLAENLKVQVFDAGFASAFTVRSAVRKMPKQGAPMTETRSWSSPRTASLGKERGRALGFTLISHSDHW